LHCTFLLIEGEKGNMDLILDKDEFGENNEKEMKG
jgi:hypothetical protein